MKKIGLYISMGILLFLVTACGSDPREQFINELSNVWSKEYNAAAFEIKIKELSYEGNKDDLRMKMLMNQLKMLSIEGKYAIDAVDDTFEMEVTANILDEKLPLKYIGNKNDYYVSTSFVSGAINLAKSFDYPLELRENQAKKIEGKYIEIGKVEEALGFEDSNETVNPFKDAASLKKKEEKIAREMKKVIENFDQKTFKKENDMLKHTFTKAEIIKLLEKINAIAAQEDNYKESEYKKDSDEFIKELKSNSQKLDVAVKINQKTKKMDMEITVPLSVEENNKSILTVMYSITPQKKTKKIKMPSEKEILSKEELQEILFTATLDDDSYLDEAVESGEYENDPEVQQLLNEKIDEIIQDIEENPEMITEESAKEIKESVAEIFTEEQMDKLNTALDNTLASKLL